MSDVMAEEVVPRFAKLHERVDQADNELQDLRERMAHLETELGVADIDKSASTFRSRRGGSDAV
ncbi:hypothetical protein J7426_01540 [Tropicibacter sp. R16_0]|uniref:hypothetical protein n=1 Tax=Tropicibacter sp. R16_0 TaxID=2821102 RepID=UPI001ADC88CC|nr:hypothetical protein [Tropicibacter sp. R16_0]MBO9448920.1 hypothetical protein [Tropicibacter sp. R16_0]